MPDTKIPHVTETLPGPAHELAPQALGSYVVETTERLTRHVLELDEHGPYLPPKSRLGQLKERTLGRGEKAAIDSQRSLALANQELAAGLQHEELSRIRGDFVNLNLRQRRQLDSFLNVTASPFINQLYGGDLELDEDWSWADWLSLEATDDQLTNFLQWHVDTLARQTISPEARDVMEEERQLYKQNLGRAIEEGWLHPSADVARYEVDDIRIVIGDMFDTFLQDRLAYHTQNSDFIVIGQGLGARGHVRVNDLKRGIQNSLAHEWNHAVLGELGAEWLNEALTEHIAQSLKYGKPHVVDPLSRQSDGGYYAPERKLLDTVLKYGPYATGDIPVSLATRAYSASPDYKKEAVDKFYSAVDKAWGTKDAIEAISGHFAKLEKQYLENKKIDKMLAPEYAAQQVISDLLQQPHVIFGEAHKREMALAG